MSTRDAYADLYLRISIDRQGKTSIERQEGDCRDWAGEHRLEVRRVHVDRGHSGYRGGAERAGLTAALTAVSSGVVGTLVVWKLDRLSRQGIGQIGRLLDTIDAADGRLVSVHDGLDTAVASDRRVIEMLAELARSESENLGLRVRSAKRYLRSQGRWIGGAAPYGLKIKNGRLAVDPRTGPVVRRIADQVLAGSSLIDVARRLNDDGVPAPRGGAWGIGTVSQLLRSPTVAGLLPETLKQGDGRFSGIVRPWKDPETGKPVSIMASGEQPLISPSDQLRIVALFDERRKLSTYGEQRGPTAGPSDYLLTGLLRCASCAGRMSKHGNSYRCQSLRLGRSCEAPGGAYRPALEAAVTQVWMDRLEALQDGDPLLRAIVERLAAVADPEAVMRRAAIHTALADEEASRKCLENDHYLMRSVDRDRFLLLHDALSRRIEDLHHALASVPAPVADASWLRDPVLIRQRWSAETVGGQRELLKLAIDEVRVSQGRQGARFVPDDRLVIRWADESGD